MVFSCLFFLGMLVPAPAPAAVPAPGVAPRHPAPPAAPPAASGQVTSFALPSPVLALAISEKAGTLAMAMPGQQVVRLYPKLLAGGGLMEAIEYPAPGVPIDVAHARLKDRGVFLVLTHRDRTLHVLDETTLAVVKKLELQGAGPLDLAVPLATAETPYAYYAYGRTSGGSVGRINLETMADDGRVELWDSVSEVAVSAGGTYLYGRVSQGEQGTLRSFLLDPASSKQHGPAAWRVVHRPHATRAYVPDPRNQFVATGRKVFSADLSRELAVVEGGADVEALHVMRRQPVMLVRADDDVLAISTNGFQQLGLLRTPLTKPGAGAARAQGQGAAQGRPAAPPAPPQYEVADSVFQYRMLAESDEGRGVALLAQCDRVVVAPFTPLGLRDEPPLYAEVSGATSLHVQRPAELRVKPADPRVKLELASGPEGARLDGERLTWTPAQHQVGEFRVNLRLSSGATERVHTITFHVRRPSVLLRFVPDDVQLSPDGNVAVALAVGLDPWHEVREPDGPRQSRIALVDVRRHAVVEERVVPYAADKVAIDETQVYLLPKNADALYVLSRKDLSDVRRVFLPGLPLNVVTGAGRVSMTVRSRHGNAQALHFRAPGLEPVWPGSSDPQRSQLATNGAHPYRLANRHYAEGVLWSEEGKPQLLVSPHGLRMVQMVEGVQRLGLPGLTQDGQNEPPIGQWGRKLSAVELLGVGGQVIANVREPAARAIVDGVPVLATLMIRSDLAGRHDGVEPRLLGKLELRDLVSGTLRHTLPLFTETRVRTANQRRGWRIRCVEGLVVVQDDARLYPVPTSAINAASFPEPLHFLPRQDVFVIDAAKPTKVPVMVRGGKGKLRFAAPVSLPGVQVNAETGEVTVSPGPILQRAASMMASAATQSLPPREEMETLTKRLDEAAARHRERFRYVTGAEATGFPVAIPVDLVVSDEEHQLAVLPRVVLMDVPLDLGVRAVAKQKEELQRELAERKLQEVQGGAGEEPAEVAALRQQLEEMDKRGAELERRMTELQAQNELLRELQREQQERQAGQEREKPN